MALRLSGIAATAIAVAVSLPFTDYGFMVSAGGLAQVLAASAWAGAAGAVLGAGIGRADFVPTVLGQVPEQDHQVLEPARALVQLLTRIAPVAQQLGEGGARLHVQAVAPAVDRDIEQLGARGHARGGPAGSRSDCRLSGRRTLSALLKVENLEASYGELRVLRGISFELAAGESLAITGVPHA